VDSWTREIGAVLRKEVRTELRTKSGLLTAGFFSIVAVVRSPSPRAVPCCRATWPQTAVGHAPICLGVSLPRAFVVEDEQGTGDLLRLYGEAPRGLLGQGAVQSRADARYGTRLSLLFTVLTNTEVTHVGSIWCPSPPDVRLSRAR